MRAVQLDAPGGALTLVDLPRPVPRPGELLVRVHAAGPVARTGVVEELGGGEVRLDGGGCEVDTKAGGVASFASGTTYPWGVDVVG